MPAKLKYMQKDERKRDGGWLYKRELPDGTWVNRAFGTDDLEGALKLYPEFHANAEHRAKTIKIKQKYADPEKSKKLRRDTFWNAVARFLIAQRAANGGKLPRPVDMEIPTSMRVTSHPFEFVRSNFLAWAVDNDPEAMVVFGLGDAREFTLFHAGIVAAYFTMSEMERIEAKEPARSRVKRGS